MLVIRHLSVLLGVFTLSILLHGCGFQLRGANLGVLDIDYRITGNLTGGGNNVDSVEFLQLLKQSFRQAGAREQSTGNVLVEITSLRREEIEGAVNAQVRVTEKSIVFTLLYRVVDAEGDDIVADQRLQVERVYRIDRNNLLASHSEQKLLETELLRNLAGQVVRGLGVVMSSRSELLTSPS
jgi:outer membrane lipopolysaccharide assembly protein LptE/RlpB